jgi:hypothetical protein
MRCDFCGIVFSRIEKEICRDMCGWGRRPLHCSLAELRMSMLAFARTLGEEAAKVMKVLPGNWAKEYNRQKEENRHVKTRET